MDFISATLMMLPVPAKDVFNGFKRDQKTPTSYTLVIQDSSGTKTYAQAL